MVVQGLWGIFMGRVNDRIGSRLVITICSLFLCLGLFLTSITAHAWELYVFYGLFVGLGMGGVFVGLISTVARWFVKKRGLMTGIVLAGIGVGTLTMAPVTNWLISMFGWRESCIVLSVCVLVIGLAAAQFLRKPPVSAISIKESRNSTPKQASQASISRGLSLGEAVHTTQFWIVLISFGCLGYCTFTITIHLVPHITDLGISTDIAAGVLSVTGVIQSFGGILFGIVADRMGSRRMMAISFIVVAASLYWLVPIATVLLFFLFAIVYSFGIGGGTAMESTITAELFGLKAHGLILGVISFGFTVGAAIGPVVTGYLFDLTGNYQIAFIVAGSFGVIGFMLTVLIKNFKKPA